MSDILVYLSDREEKPRGDRPVLFANVDMSKKKKYKQLTSFKHKGIEHTSRCVDFL